MAITLIPPIKGFSEGFNADDTPNEYSSYMNNVRPFDTLERKLRLGQRPGLDKAYTQQIASVAGPIRMNIGAAASSTVGIEIPEASSPLWVPIDDVSQLYFYSATDGDIVDILYVVG